MNGVSNICRNPLREAKIIILWYRENIIYELYCNDVAILFARIRSLFFKFALLKFAVFCYHSRNPLREDKIIILLQVSYKIKEIRLWVAILFARIRSLF